MLRKKCCCNCIIFADLLEDEDELGGWWNVISGSMTPGAGSYAVIAAGSVIGPTVNQPTGSGSFFLNVMGDITKTLTVRFAFKDLNNHWRVQLARTTVNSGFQSGGRPVIYDCWMAKFYETVGGSEEYIGSRPIVFPHVANPAPGGSAVVLSSETMRVQFEFCWHEGGRVVVVAPTATTGVFDYTLVWPCSVVGGNSFRIEPGYDLQVHEGDWRYHLIEHPEIGPFALLSNPGGCNCSTYNCLTCKGKWSDRMRIEFLDGPYAGDGVTADRFRDYSTTDDGRSFGYPLNYWQFYINPQWDFFGPADPDGHDWDAYLVFCEGNNDPDNPFDADRTTGGYLRMVHHGALPDVGGENLFDTDDCDGPYTTTMRNNMGPDVTVQITPNAP